MRLSSFVKIFAPLLLLAGLLPGLYVWQFGWQSPWRFDLAWDEEVQLHDQRIIQVHIRRSYERHSLLTPRDAVRLSTEISFDAGAPWGRIRQQFAEDVALIDEDQQVWYFAAAPSSAVPGPPRGDATVTFWKLQAGQPLQPARRGEKLPEAFVRWNVMPATPDAAALAKFDHTQLRLNEKMRHWAAHPRSEGEEAVRLDPLRTGPPARR
ncbi:MAG: hypothetical protein EOO54_07595 [Haliea sp.]|nr:MAG: hypothetical protein EOO54_07595 [Haliea sp.]